MPDTKDAFVPIETALSTAMASYISVLTGQGTRSLALHTGAGRIYRDLLLNWPIVKNWEDQAQTLCRKITEAVYPLTGALFAQAIEIAVVISPKQIKAPARVEALSTYVIFDTQNTLERQFFLSPEHPLPQTGMLSTAEGIVVFCRPLNYRYHTLKDDRKRALHPRVGMYELVERQINALHERHDFIAKDRVALDSLSTDIGEDTLRAEDADMLDDARGLLSNAPAFAIGTVAGLSTLPAAALVIEDLLLSRSSDRTLSDRLRLELRQMAQELRLSYPQTIIRELLHLKNASPAPVPQPPIPAGPETQATTTALPELMAAGLAVAPVILVQREDEIAQPVVNEQVGQTFSLPDQEDRRGLEKRAQVDVFYGRNPDPELYSSGLMFYRNAYDEAMRMKQQEMDASIPHQPEAIASVSEASSRQEESASTAEAPAPSVLPEAVVLTAITPAQPMAADIATEAVIPIAVAPSIVGNTPMQQTEARPSEGGGLPPTEASIAGQDTTAMQAVMNVPRQQQALVPSTSGAHASAPIEQPHAIEPQASPRTETPVVPQDASVQQSFADASTQPRAQIASASSTQGSLPIEQTNTTAARSSRQVEVPTTVREASIQQPFTDASTQPQVQVASTSSTKALSPINQPETTVAQALRQTEVPANTQSPVTQTSFTNASTQPQVQIASTAGTPTSAPIERVEVTRGELSTQQQSALSIPAQEQNSHIASLIEPLRPLALQQRATSGEALTFPPSSAAAQRDVLFAQTKEFTPHPVAMVAIDKQGNYEGLRPTSAALAPSSAKLNPEDLLNLEKSIIAQSVLTQSPLWTSAPLIAALAVSQKTAAKGRGKKVTKSSVLLASGSKPQAKFPTPEPFPTSPTKIKT